MTEEFRYEICEAVCNEDMIKISQIVGIFRDAGSSRCDVAAMFRMACPWLDGSESRKIVEIAGL